MCKHHSAVFPNQVSSFNPRGKEDFKWSTVAEKPRYSEQMEGGVLYFVAPEKAQRDRYGAEHQPLKEIIYLLMEVPKIRAKNYHY